MILGFVVLQKQHEKTISAATDTEGKTEIAIEIGKAGKGDGQETSEGETSGEDAVSDAAGTRENETESVYLIKGNDTGSNPYEKADHLAYTDSVRYTEEELSRLDSYGLCITRNEIYARHGRELSPRAYLALAVVSAAVVYFGSFAFWAWLWVHDTALFGATVPQRERLCMADKGSGKSQPGSLILLPPYCIRKCRHCSILSTNEC